MGWTRSAGLAAAVLIPAAVFLAQSGPFRAANSVTCDETFYLNAAHAIFARGDFDPCARYGVAPLPIVLEYGPAVWAGDGRPSDDAWIGTLDDPELIDDARLTSAVVVGCSLLALVAGWAYRRTGSVGAALTVGLLVALSPVVSSHASLATTDTCFSLFFLAALLALGRSATAPTAGRFVIAGGLVGLAVAAKYTGLILLPVGYLIGVMADGQQAFGIRQRLARLVTVHPVRQLGLAAVAGVVVWAVTGFEVSPSPISSRSAADLPPGTGIRRILGNGPAANAVIDLAHRTHLPSPVVGAYRQFAMAADSSRPVFPTQLFEQVYPSGHKLYYTWAFLLKSTPAELVLLAVLGIGVGCRVVAWKRPVGAEWAPVAIGVGVLFVLCSMSSKQFGLRYLLPIYPALVVTAVSGLHDRFGCRPVVLGTIVTALVGWQVVSAASASPHPLSYVNSLAGGPGRGHECLGNSDIDWGQGLIGLKDFLDDQGESAVLISTLGSTPPAAYGVNPLPWRDYPTPPCRYIAVGATILHRNPDLDPRIWPLRGVRPAAVVGGSILVFDTADPAVWSAYTEGLVQLRPAAINVNPAPE